MDRHEVEQLLLSERTRLIDARSQLSVGGGPATAGDGAIDTSSAAHAIEERDSATALTERVDADLAEIDAALARLKAGRYGRCEACDAAIPVERLEAFPAARYCVTDQRAHERPRSLGS